MNPFTALAQAVPFLAPYPTWAKGLFSCWLLLTALCLATIVFARRPETVAAPATALAEVGDATGSSLRLVVERVELFDADWADAGIRVTVDVNGNRFVYPSLEGVRWLMVGPDMSSQTFKLPPSDRLNLRFTMEALHPRDAGRGREPTRFVSQETVELDRRKLPFDGAYRVYQVGSEQFRSGAISAIIHFAVTGG